MSDWLALGAYVLVMSITPGPNNVMVLASGARFGLRRTLPHLTGISLGFTVQVTVVCAGLGVALARFQLAQAWLRWIGIGYMFYLAFKLLRAGAVGSAHAARPLSAVEAAVFQAVNPKAWVAALTMASVFMPKSGSLPLAAASMALVLVAVNFPCASIWAVCGSALSSWLDHPRRRFIFNVTMALLMALTGLSMLLGG